MGPSPTIRRLLRETAELSASSPNPSPAFHASPVSDSNLYEWHFTLLGPPSPSPYAGGLYHGRISLPLQYPLKPPNFRFLTPSGRFEINREICLSISGFHEETWMPAWGVRTALTALRSFMAEKGSAGQVGGMEAGVGVRERLARESRAWRCEGCGGRTNEEDMKEWWDACREQGVKVEEEMGLESLPEGLKLEPLVKNEPQPVSVVESNDTERGSTYHPEGSASISQPPEESRAQPTQRQALSTDPLSSIVPLEQPPADSARAQSISPPSAPPIKPPSPSLRQSQAPSSSSKPQPPTAPSPSSRLQSLSSTPVTRTTTRTATTATLPPLASPSNLTAPSTPGPPEAPTATIDKAIGALVLALCLMILKKIFYPARSPIDDFDDYGLMVTR